MERETAEGFKVKDLFAVPHFRDAVLVAGRDGLERPISRINVMEVPDVVDWVRPGEFLMTTGYPFRDDPDVLATLVAQLARKGVAALGLKTKRFVEAVPAAAIAAADRHGLPLIELPPGTTFSDAVREVMERVLVAESRDLSVLQGRVQRLSRVLLHGDGLPAFLNHLQTMVRNPVALLDPDNGWIASSDTERLCGSLDGFDWDALRVRLGPEAGSAPDGPGGARVHAAALTDGRAHPHLLLLFEREGETGAVDMLTINWAGRLLGLEISNTEARKSIEAKYFDQFLQDWIAGRIVSDADLQLRAEACGWALPDRSAYAVGVVSFDGPPPTPRALRELAGRLNRERTLRKSETKWTVMEGGLVALLARRTAADCAAEGDGGAEAAAAVLQAALPERTFALCLGRETAESGRVNGSYRDAKRAADVRETCRLAGPVVRYGELGVYMLLYRLLGTEELDAYMRLYLDPLLALEGKQHGALLTTLRTYFECNCNAKEAADRMFVHYNTIGYRLERIRSELGFRLDDPETKLQLQLAIKAHEIAGVQPQRGG